MARGRTLALLELIKRTYPAGAEFRPARELARVLKYTDFRNFIVANIVHARQGAASTLIAPHADSAGNYLGPKAANLA